MLIDAHNLRLCISLDHLTLYEYLKPANGLSAASAKAAKQK